jgi:hypothetical protein
LKLINFIFFIYYRLPHDKSIGLFTKVVNRIFAKIFKFLLDLFIEPIFLKTFNSYSNGLNELPREKKCIVSLTSFPGRIENVWIVIECLLRQSYKPDAIILWLSKHQFNGTSIPDSLLKQQQRGLTIKFVDDDLKSHKKYLYAFDLYPNDYMVTVDDDLYYDEDLIDNLIKMKSKFPNSIATNRCHKMLINNVGEIQKYGRWMHNSTELKPSYILFPTCGFGTLYSRQDFTDSYNNIELIKKLAPFADDIWLKIQTLLANSSIVTNNKYNKDPLTVKSSQIESLVKVNVQAGRNDEQLEAVLIYFNIRNFNYFLEKGKSLD